MSDLHPPPPPIQNRFAVPVVRTFNLIKILTDVWNISKHDAGQSPGCEEQFLHWYLLSFLVPALVHTRGHRGGSAGCGMGHYFCRGMRDGRLYFGGMRDGQFLRDAGLAGFLGGMTG